MEWLDSLLNYFNEMFEKFMDAMWCMFESILVFLYKMCLELLNWVANLSLFNKAPYNIQDYVDQIPHNIQVVIGYVSINSALAIVLGAYVIRIGLRCIPWVRGLFA